ncbi:MAG TPA: hypothetical protein VGI54_09795 [Solirubrobacteraceae bacterium]
MSGSRRSITRRLAVIAAALAGSVVPAASAMAQPTDNGPIVGRTPVVVATHSSPTVATQSPDARDANLAALIEPGSSPTVATQSPDAQDANLAALIEPASRPDPRSPDARDAALVATGHAPATVPPTPTQVVVHDHPDALPLALSIAALLIALAGWGFVVARRGATKRPVAGLGH